MVRETVETVTQVQEAPILEEKSQADEPEVSTASASTSKASQKKGDLMSLEQAVKRIPEDLKQEMKDLLRAEFREVRRL